MSLHDVSINSREAANVVGMSYETLKTWFRRNAELGKGTEEDHAMIGGGVQGRNRMFNFRNIIETAVMWNLVDRADVSLGRASIAGATFAYSGGLSHGTMDLGERVSPRLRIPGLPFYDPAFPLMTTFAFVSEKGCTVTSANGGFDMLTAVKVAQGGLPPGAYIDCSDVFFNVCIRLGLRPLDEIEREYSERNQELAKSLGQG